LMIVAAAAGLGVWLRRWWLLALPIAAATGAAFLLVMPGTHVDPDNPLAFLLIAVEASMAAGIALGNRVRRTPTMA